CRSAPGAGGPCPTICFFPDFSDPRLMPHFQRDPGDAEPLPRWLRTPRHPTRDMIERVLDLIALARQLRREGYAAELHEDSRRITYHASQHSFHPVPPRNTHDVIALLVGEPPLTTSPVPADAGWTLGEPPRPRRVPIGDDLVLTNGPSLAVVWRRELWA